ncbi:TIGR02391 family protein [Agromyces allii]|uniref:Conserved hypothetical protein CHP02391 domain-containing protein n=1 Tax=Agromyces allii TaxID=393607 RepID=A0ABN2PZ45_9MICO|nr:TIGR02391 family protein [Agromyces allii]
MTADEELVLKFDPQTVDHLGAKMYSHLPNAVAELVANAYDADASTVFITIGDGEIAIEDDGHGMTRSEVADRYLRIGRNRRNELDSARTESGKRPVSGKKGLGKLALFGIGKRVELTTTRQGADSATHVVLDYDAMMASDREYRPGETQVASPPAEHGTKVRLSELKRNTPVDSVDLANSLSKLFNYVDDGFQILVIGQDGVSHQVTADRRLGAVNVEFDWEFPDCLDSSTDWAMIAKGVRGRVVSAKTPLRHGMRGITLYVNGRLANEPEYFGASESSFAFSYFTGYLEVDFLDNLEPDVIATDRRAIDWETDVTIELREWLQALMLKLNQEWRRRRAEAGKKKTEETLGVSTEEWVGSIQGPKRTEVEALVEAVTSEDVALEVEQQTKILEIVKGIAPPHADYVWRNLHPAIKSVTHDDYEKGDYYRAVMEAVKRYVGTLRNLHESLDDVAEGKLFNEAFSAQSPRLDVFKKFTEEYSFTSDTGDNIHAGQRGISQGIWQGFRNPLNHEEIGKLKASGAFTYEDCLDALAIISHLMRRMDGVVVRED